MSAPAPFSLLQKTCASSSPPLNYASLVAAKREYNAVSAERPMKFSNIVRVESFTIFNKDHDMRRKVDRSKVLAAKHTASLQLLCTVGGDLAGPRTVAKYIFFKGGAPLLQNFTFGTRIRPRLVATNCT